MVDRLDLLIDAFLRLAVRHHVVTEQQVVEALLIQLESARHDSASDVHIMQLTSFGELLMTVTREQTYRYTDMLIAILRIHRGGGRSNKLHVH